MRGECQLLSQANIKSHRYFCRSVAFSSKQIRFLSLFVFLCEEAMYCESLLAYTTYLFNHGSVACSVTDPYCLLLSLFFFCFFLISWKL